MRHIVFRVEDEGAERLWNYLLAYKKMIGKNEFIEKKHFATDSVTSINVPG